jgi:hypothetical protein
MLAAAHGSGSGGFLSSNQAALISLASLFVAIATLILNYVLFVLRRRFIYGMTVSAPLVNRSTARPDLHILWRDQEVADPHVLEIELAYRGRADVESSDFDKGRPFSLDVGVPIIQLLDTVPHPDKEPLPRVEAVGTELKIGPDLFRKGQAMTFVVLADGPGDHVKCVNPVANVKDRQVRYQARQEPSSGNLRKIITWAIALFIIFYIVTQPDGAADFVHHAYNGLHDAGNSMARFVNSL